MEKVSIIGGGLAGCEAALALASRGVDVVLYEMRPEVQTEVHRTQNLAELVCSNSFKSTKPDSAAGLLKSELSMLGCSLLPLAEKASVPAGGALAVNREIFSNLVEEAVENNPHITLVRKEITEIPEGRVIVAAGPLCSDALANEIEKLTGAEHMAFYDAAAPIVEAESLNMDILFAQSRYDKGEGADYLNAPFNKEEYENFIQELVNADRVVLKNFEKGELFSACQPAEEIARTGVDSLRFGAMKPVGLTDPRTFSRPWAAIQLRAENLEGTAYNLVGFQTNLTFPEQRRVFKMIPGLENAEFSRYGVMHRNTFVNAPQALDETFALKGQRNIRFAGQITGTEGYVEAIASGLLAALNTYADIQGYDSVILPETGSFGSLVAWATNPQTIDYQPMHVNFGVQKPFDDDVKRKKQERYQAYTSRAKKYLNDWIVENKKYFPEA